MELSTVEGFELVERIVFKKVKETLFVIPGNITSHILYICHNDLSHTGIEKTIKAIMNSYWFPCIKNKVRVHI